MGKVCRRNIDVDELDKVKREKIKFFLLPSDARSAIFHVFDSISYSAGAVTGGNNDSSALSAARQGRGRNGEEKALDDVRHEFSTKNIFSFSAVGARHTE